MPVFSLKFLPHIAHEFMAARFADGGALTRALTERINLQGGHVFTFLPADISDAQALDFETGGKLELLKSDVLHFDHTDSGEHARWCDIDPSALHSLT